MNELFDLSYLLAHADVLNQLNLKNMVFITLFYGGQIVAVLFAARSIVTYVGRKCGFYHPNHYRYWPRLPWRPVYRVWVGIEKWYERVFLLSKRGGTGGFTSSFGTFSLLYQPGNFLLGRAYAFGLGMLQPVGISELSRHAFFLAMTGVGKTSALITMLSTWKNSVFLIDPKGQVTYALAYLDWRRWFVIDPYGITPFNSAYFNAVDCLVEAVNRDGKGAAVLWASRIAFALISTPAGSRSPYFYDVARAFLCGLILHVYTEHPEADWNLPFIRRLIVEGLKVHNENGQEETKGSEAHALLLYVMAKNTAFNGAISGAAAAMTQASGETGGNLWSTLQDQTRFLDLPAVCAVLRETSLPLSDLKTRNDVVLSFTAPVLSIRQELAPLARLLTNMTAYTFEAIKQKNGTCLTMIDELPSQGYNETFLTTLAVGRSQGQLLVGIAQNLGQMKSVYPKDYATFIGEADAVYWMASAHVETTEMLARLLGKKTLIDKDRYTGRKSYREVPVIDADQVRRFLNPDSQNIIVTRAGSRALRLKNEPYYKALPVWKYWPDPDHKEAFLRRITRAVLGRKVIDFAHSKPLDDEASGFVDPSPREANTPMNEPIITITEEINHE